MSRLGGLGIQAFTNLSGNASRLISNAFDRTLNSQQYLISQLEQDRQRKLQQSYAEEQQEKAEKKALQDQLLATAIGVAGGALTGGLLAAAAPAAGAGAAGLGAAAGEAAGAGAAALGAPALASGVSGAALGTGAGAATGAGLGIGGGALLGGAIGGLSTLPGGAVPAQLLGQSTPLFNPQIGINQQRLAMDAAHLTQQGVRDAAYIKNLGESRRLREAELKQSQSNADREYKLANKRETRLGQPPQPTPLDPITSDYRKAQTANLRSQVDSRNADNSLLNRLGAGVKDVFETGVDALGRYGAAYARSPAGEIQGLAPLLESSNPEVAAAARARLQGGGRSGGSSMIERIIDESVANGDITPDRGRQIKLDIAIGKKPEGVPPSIAESIRLIGLQANPFTPEGLITPEALAGAQNRVNSSFAGQSAIPAQLSGNAQQVKQQALQAASPEEARSIINGAAISAEEKKMLLEALGG